MAAGPFSCRRVHTPYAAKNMSSAVSTCAGICAATRAASSPSSIARLIGSPITSQFSCVAASSASTARTSPAAWRSSTTAVSAMIARRGPRSPSAASGPPCPIASDGATVSGGCCAGGYTDPPLWWRTPASPVHGGAASNVPRPSRRAESVDESPTRAMTATPDTIPTQTFRVRTPRPAPAPAPIRIATVQMKKTYPRVSRGTGVSLISEGYETLRESARAFPIRASAARTTAQGTRTTS